MREELTTVHTGWSNGLTDKGTASQHPSKTKTADLVMGSANSDQ